jgi:hypothetical protein
MTKRPPTPGTAARPDLPGPAGELIDRRYSCRTYLERPISDEDKALLGEFMASRTTGPLGSQSRFGLIAAAPDDRQALRRLGTYGFIKGATGFIVGAVERAPKDLEDYGYLLEEVILAATGIGLGTCWLGGTFTRSTFVRRFGGLQRGETMPAVVSTGYIGDDGTERIREREEGARRFQPAELFFEGRWGVSMAAAGGGTGGSAAAGRDAGAGRYAGGGRCAAALEAVRMAPSATNKQPWRVVRTASPEGGPAGGRDWHFFMVRTKGYGKGSAVFTVLRIADLQRVDLGIAMCHFELVARESGLRGSWVVADPGIDLPGPGIEYTATWREAD